MRASSEFASRQGPSSVYGRLTGLGPWRPPGSGHRTAQVEAIAEIADRLFDRSQRDNEGLPAAYTFFGQFVTHDITFDTRLDPRSARGARQDRTPALDLDSVY